MKKKLDILYEDKYIIIVNKEAGLLTIASDKEKIKTLYHEVSTYLKKQNKNNKVFIVHRLDKDTSGIVLLAKNKKVKEELQNNWHLFKREYYAVVYGNVLKKFGTIKNYLSETKTYLVHKSNKKYGKLAITHYQKIKSNSKYSLLKINIETGRKHQIRVHLNDLGYPIVGDKLYNKIKNKGLKRLYLHASSLEFIHPISKESMFINSTYPEIFNNLCK